MASVSGSSLSSKKQSSHKPQPLKGKTLRDSDLNLEHIKMVKQLPDNFVPKTVATYLKNLEDFLADK